MIPSIYEKHVHNDPEFPFYFHTGMRVFSRSPSQFHWHESIELLYILEGGCRVVCGQRNLRARAGDLIVINPGSLHSVYHEGSPEAAPAVYHCLIVDKSFCDAMKLYLSDMWFTECLRAPEAGSLMRAIADEVKEKREFYKLQVQFQVTSLLVFLCRSARTVKPPDETGRGTNKIQVVKAAIEFLRLHFAEPLSIETICGHIGFSRYYLCHSFREVTGCTVVEYINSLRCAYALQLLSSGGYTVSECAERCGFHTMSYFSKVYQRYRGCPPSSDRKQVDTAE